MAEQFSDARSLSDYLVVLLRWRRIIVLNVLTVTLVTIVIALIVPQWYTSTASVIPSKQSGLEAGLMSYVQASLPIFNLPGAASHSQALLAILQSRRVAEAVIRQNGLVEIYRSDTIEGAILILRDRSELVLDENGVLLASVEARDPGLARDIAASYLAELEIYNADVRSTSGRRVRLFVEGRLDEIRARLAEAEQQLVSFQRENASVEMSEQARATINALADLEARITMTEIQLGLARGYASDDHPEVVRLESELREYRLQLVSLSVGGAAGPNGVTIPLAEMPGLVVELAGLMRETSILSQVYLYLVQECEAARIQETRDTPTIQVLDVPRIPEIRTRPKRVVMVITGALIGLVIGVLAALVLEFLNTTDSSDPMRRNLDAAAAMLRSDLGRLTGRGGRS